MGTQRLEAGDAVLVTQYITVGILHLSGATKTTVLRTVMDRVSTTVERYHDHSNSFFVFFFSLIFLFKFIFL